MIKVYKGRDHVTRATSPSTHSHRQNISSATNSPPLLHQPPRTPRKKDKKNMHTMSKLLEKDKAVILLLPQLFSEEQPSLFLCLFL
jgi:hypothetical protein